MINYTQKDVERFWSKVKIGAPDECWEWQAGKYENGYGQFSIGRKQKHIYAHRFSYEITFGEPGSLFVLHKCDRPSCVNPNHLFIGTHQDNMDDMKEKERQPKGEDRPDSKLSNRQASAIRERYLKGGVTQTQLSEEYHVSISTVNKILEQRAYKDGTPFIETRKGKLTDEQAWEIVDIYGRCGISQAEVGRMYGVTAGAVNLIVHGKNHKGK